MRLLTLRDVADMTQLSERTVRRQVRKGALPAQKVLGVIRIKESDAEEFARGQTVNPDGAIIPKRQSE